MTRATDPRQNPSARDAIRGSAKTRHSRLSPEQKKAALAAKRNGAAARLNTVGACLAYVIKDDFVRFAGCKLTETRTTSDAPLLRIEYPNGEVFHVTVTRARK
jgi:hypothetical protein